MMSFFLCTMGLCGHGSDALAAEAGKPGGTAGALPANVVKPNVLCSTRPSHLACRLFSLFVHSERRMKSRRSFSFFFSMASPSQSRKVSQPEGHKNHVEPVTKSSLSKLT